MLRRPADRDHWLALVAELGHAIASTQQRCQKWLAWEHLQRTDEESSSRVSPYTPKAIEILEALNERAEDGEAIHHLAIALHAMAWDLELSSDPQAASAWEKALSCWQALQSRADFWRRLYREGEALGTEFDKSAVASFRRHLIVYLLEIHVEFVLYYYDLGKHDEALRHVELVRRARISPAARRRLQALVFEALQPRVSQMVSEGAFAAGLGMLDGFLNLFPGHPQALRIYLEVAEQYLKGLSPLNDRQEILELDRRVLPCWEALNAVRKVNDEPLIDASLHNVANLMGCKHLARARSLKAGREAARLDSDLESEEYRAYELSILWLRKVDSDAPDGPDVRSQLNEALLSKAVFLAQAGFDSNDPEETFRLLELALLDCQAAMEETPEEAASWRLAAQILHRRAELRLTQIPAGADETVFAAHLDEVEMDLERALRFDPENGVLREILDEVRRSR